MDTETSGSPLNIAVPLEKLTAWKKRIEQLERERAVLTKHVDRCADQIEENKRLRGLVRRAAKVIDRAADQWIWHDGPCPGCGAYGNHEDDCDLIKVLNEAKEIDP